MFLFHHGRKVKAIVNFIVKYLKIYKIQRPKKNLKKHKAVVKTSYFFEKQGTIGHFPLPKVYLRIFFGDQRFVAAEPDNTLIS